MQRATEKIIFSKSPCKYHIHTTQDSIRAMNFIAIELNHDATKCDRQWREMQIYIALPSAGDLYYLYSLNRFFPSVSYRVVSEFGVVSLEPVAQAKAREAQLEYEKKIREIIDSDLIEISDIVAKLGEAKLTRVKYIGYKNCTTRLHKSYERNSRP